MYNKEAYEKLKQEAPDKLKEYRTKAYITFKEKNPDKLTELRKAASAKYYKEHKEEIAARRKEKYVSKRKNPLKYLQGGNLRSKGGTTSILVPSQPSLNQEKEGL